MAEAKSLRCGSANSVGSFSASNSPASSASSKVGTFFTGRGTISFRAPKAKSKTTCAAKTSATSVSHRPQRPSPPPDGSRRGGTGIGSPAEWRFGGSRVHGTTGAVTAPRQGGQQRVLDAGVAGEQRQVDQLLVGHGLVGVDDQRERFAGFVDGGAEGPILICLR